MSRVWLLVGVAAMMLSGFSIAGEVARDVLGASGMRAGHRSGAAFQDEPP